VSPLERRARTVLVEALLDELAEERQELYRRKTFGVRAPALRDLKTNLETTQRRLAELATAA
jgi:hypothetical protein